MTIDWFRSCIHARKQRLKIGEGNSGDSSYGSNLKKSVGEQCHVGVCRRQANYPEHWAIKPELSFG